MTGAMKTIFRWPLALVMLALIAFCVFGFLATYEPMPTLHRWVWRTVYGLVGLACTIGLIRPLRCWGRHKR